MPVVPGLTGYQDWQRTSQVDTPALLVKQSVAEPAPVQLPGVGTTYDVSRFAAIGLSVAAAGFPMTIDLRWSLDPAGAVVVGRREFAVYDSSVIFGPQAHFYFTNLGPFLTLSAKTLLGPNAFTWSCTLFGTNRSSALESQVLNHVLYKVSGQAIAASGNFTANIPAYWAGRAQVFMVISTAGDARVFFRSHNTDSTVSPFNTNFFTGQGSAEFIMPLGWVDVTVQNAVAAAATFDLTVIADGGGS